MKIFSLSKGAVQLSLKFGGYTYNLGMMWGNGTSSYMDFHPNQIQNPRVFVGSSFGSNNSCPNNLYLLMYPGDEFGVTTSNVGLDSGTLEYTLYSFS